MQSLRFTMRNTVTPRQFLNFIAMSSRSICSLRSIGDKASRIMKEIARLRSKEAPSTRELPNYDEGRWKRRAGPVLYDFNASRHIFGTKLIKGIIFQNLIFHSLRSIIIDLYYSFILYSVLLLCNTSSFFFKYGEILKQFPLQ